MSLEIKTDENNNKYYQGNGVRYYVDCNYCDRERENGSTFFPPHNASDRCQSGKYKHCTCDICF